MTWFKVDDKLPTSRKVLSIRRTDRRRLVAMGLWVLAGAWCASGLTDGNVPAYMVDELGGDEEAAGWLVEAGLWTVTPDGWAFHDWTQCNPTRAKVEEKREEARVRMENLREEARARKANAESGSSPVRANAKGTSPRVRSPRPDPTRPVQKSPTGAEAPAESTPGANELVAEWIDNCQGGRPPDRVVGHVARELGAMLAEGIPYADVRRGLQSWHTKGLVPANLAAEVHLLRNPRTAHRPGAVGLDLDQARRDAEARAGQKELTP